MSPVQVGELLLRIEGDVAPFQASLAVIQLAPRLHAVTLSLRHDAEGTDRAPATPPAFKLVWSYSAIDIQSAWHPGAGRNRQICWCGVRSKANSHAPVICLHNRAGKNRLTFACSDALNTLDLGAGVYKEMGKASASIGFFAAPTDPLSHYEATILFDTRDIAYHEALANVSKWWEQVYPPLPVPPAALDPMYSTWYSFFQAPEPAAVLKQGIFAKQLGCEALILDDGWQMTQSEVGYSYCGDWRPQRVGDMKAYVDSFHAAGLKFLLWYSTVHLGKHAAILDRFKDKILGTDRIFDAHILDSRFPDVREYLIEAFVHGLSQWSLDGLKLDFIENFSADGEFGGKQGEGRDYISVAAATERLLHDLLPRLQAVKPDIMTEFRQGYIGPVMRQYGNIFRAVDCPHDSMTNRVRILDLRLLAGNTAVHSDMFMWHPGESVEVAALQLLDVLFAVPQLSVLIDQLPEEHRQMLAFYLGFWKDHRDVLLGGRLEPLHPESLYPVVRASTPAKRLLAIYDEAIANVGPDVPRELLLVNATRASRIVIELPEALPDRQLQVLDCRGRCVERGPLSLSAGVHALMVPPSGSICLA